MNTDSWFWGFCTVLGNLSCTPCKILKTKNQYFFFQVFYVKRAPRKLATKFFDLPILVLGFYLHHSTQSYASMFISAGSENCAFRHSEKHAFCRATYSIAFPFLVFMELPNSETTNG
jgi:hypothetical protein